MPKRPTSSKRPPSSKSDLNTRNRAQGGGLVLLLVALFGAMLLVSHGKPYGPVGASRDLPHCPNVMEEVERLICRLPSGIVGFNAPSTMTRGEPHVISLIVSVTDSGADLIQKVRSATSDTTSKVELVPVKLSQRMVARLEGQGFHITPKASDATPVAVPKRDGAEWDWQVTPIASGEQLLVLTLDALLPLKGGDAPNRQTVLRRRIHVDVSARGRLSDLADWLNAHWQLLAGLGVLASGVLLWLRAKRSGRRFFPLP